MDEWTSYAGRLLWAMRRAGKTNQSELARTVGIKPQSIQYLCRPEAGAQGSKHTAALAVALGVSSRWLARNEGSPDAAEGPGAAGEPGGLAAYEGAAAHQAGVVGSYRVSGSGDVEKIDLPAGETDGHVLLPLLVPHTQAVRVKGNALAPFVKDGQYLLIQASGAVQPEENIVITLKSGRTLIRELMHDRADTLVVLPLHGGQPEAIERHDIAQVFPILCALPRSRWRADDLS